MEHAFIIDEMGSNQNFHYTPFHHEQSAAMAADAVYRVDKSQIGVTVATSGPGQQILLQELHVLILTQFQVFI